MIYVLYNPLAANGTGEIKFHDAMEQLGIVEGEIKAFDVTKLDTKEFASGLTKEDKIILIGGDGTLNHYANEKANVTIPCAEYLYAAGTGNDFIKDVAKEVKGNLVDIKQYTENLPTVTINGKKSYFLNGVGFGIDGEACRVADDKKAAGVEKIDYTAISIKLLLVGMKPRKATVTIDGVTKKYKHVWLASAMKGVYYGGGMQIAPNQDRKSDLLTCVIIRGACRIATLIRFPAIFKGEHVKYKKVTHITTGKEITVTFDRPTALQIDGETVRDVLTYTVKI